MNVLITGGAGFIGSHVADELLRCGHAVRAFDNLDTQVHGVDGRRPAYLAPEVELVIGDVRDRDALKGALTGIDAVIHLAARVGVAQSMYEVEAYFDVNVRGTAVLLELLPQTRVGRLLIASSMTMYGEGLSRDSNGTLVEDACRTPAQLAAGIWEPCGADGAPLSPLPTPQHKRPSLNSNYAISKYTQERMALVTARAHNIEAAALRLFNVYGTRQALSNPYNGIFAIFASRLMNGRPPLLFEDGGQRRDFVHVSDVARAFRLALERPGIEGLALNIASGESHTVGEIARRLAKAMNVGIEPEITGRCRAGDTRHCFADIAAARTQLGFAPRVPLDEGMAQLVDWLTGQEACDRIEHANQEMIARGLMR